MGVYAVKGPTTVASTETRYLVEVRGNGRYVPKGQWVTWSAGSRGEATLEAAYDRVAQLVHKKGIARYRESDLRIVRVTTTTVREVLDT